MFHQSISPDEMQHVIDEVRNIFQDDAMAERILREPSFAKRVLLGEPFRPYSFFSAIQEVGKDDPSSALRMMQHLHAGGSLRTLYDMKEGGMSSESETERERHRIDRMLFIALNKAGFREGELVKEHGEEVMIKRAILYVNTVRSGYGVPPIGLNEEDYRILENGSTKNIIWGGETLGTANSSNEEITVVRKESDAQKLAIFVHESIHLVSDSQLSLNNVNDYDHPTSGGVGKIKSGLNEKTFENKNVDEKFVWLDEALTEELSARFVRGLGEDDPDFGEMVKQRKIALAKYQAVHTDHGAVDVQGFFDEPLDVSVNEDGQLTPIMSTYENYRTNLWELASELRQKNPSAFEGLSPEASNEKIFALLVKAKFTGNLVPFALLYDSAFGEGAFAATSQGTYDTMQRRSSRAKYYPPVDGGLHIFSDENFPDATIVREGNVGYALRKNTEGEIEGNKITYLENGDVGPVYELHENDIEELQKKGVIDVAGF